MDKKSLMCSAVAGLVFNIPNFPASPLSVCALLGLLFKLEFISKLWCFFSPQQAHHAQSLRTQLGLCACQFTIFSLAVFALSLELLC